MKSMKTFFFEKTVITGKPELQWEPKKFRNFFANYFIKLNFLQAYIQKIENLTTDF